MSALNFYPKITKELMDDCGFSIGKYDFFYRTPEGTKIELSQKGKSTIKLEDASESWKVEMEGLSLSKRIRVEYPRLLFGKSGIICQNAEIGMCIIWTNNTLTQTGHILPADTNAEEDDSGVTYRFDHTFLPGEISGDLSLDVILYVKRRADELLEGEENLINKEGVSLGVVESVSLDFNSAFMDFPIEEFSANGQSFKDIPLCWIEFPGWDDPKVDLFNKETVCIYLNRDNPACPLAGERIKNEELLIEIISTSYYMIFQKLSDEDLILAKGEKGYQPYSTCSILHEFIKDCKYDLRWESSESLKKSIQINVEAKFREERE